MSKDFLIINKPSVSLTQLNIWSKHKSVLFRQLIPIAYKISVQYGIDPVVVIAQIALETGYCTFNGQVPSSYHNTCGLKTSDGKAFQCFNDWKEGIEAHVQHLALYANSSKLANKKIIDPRHFESLRGSAKTVNALSNKWATNSIYGKKINTLCDEILKS